ncbi:MAG: gamma-glutamyl-gamma-aminobutyrate hydrolase family protein [Anaerolineae bacterium]|nr:gamma-glutamyl-gamma-aminobutyrate hydrolase family protein [Anaerolineae bacterium]
MPLIGVTASRSETKSDLPRAQVNETYIQALLQAGGTPLILPVGLSEEHLLPLCSSLDGFLLTGGADIDPALFGGQPHAEVYGIDHARDRMEIALTRLCAQNNIPLLAICRGIQVMNVALGGTLYTHIADQLPNALRHDWYPNFARDRLSHRVRIEKDSQLYRILGSETLEVNSLHHQGVAKVAPGLLASAFSPDQLVEALELRGHPFAIGVQWHPEELTAHLPMRALFNAFIQAASSSRRYGA